MTLHVVSISGGTASAVAADRVLSRYGHDTTRLFFADTKWEDEDLYRFLNDLEQHWGHEIIRVSEGRTPLEVAEQASIIPNQKRAPCSLALKIVPFRKFLDQQIKPVVVYLGLDWTEQHRGVRPKAEYEAMSGVTVEFPLLWKPMANPPHRTVVESWGIKAPRLYDMGFPHNNCGGRCVKQGLAEWLRLRAHFPERFEEVAEWEERQRAKGGARADYAIARDQSGGTVKPLPLRVLEKQNEGRQLPMGTTTEDMFACFCSY